ncbi:HDIG domain-containing protein [bacterium]|nr:HDIG domain-containing protein [bacterium]
MPEALESDIKDLSPSKWMRFRAIWRKWDRRLYMSDAFASLALVAFISLMLRQRWSPQNLDLSRYESSTWIYLLMSFAFWALQIFLRREAPEFVAKRKDALVGMFVLATSLACFKLILIFQMDLLAGYFVGVPATLFLFLIPVAAPTMILRLLMKPPQVLLFAFVHALCLAYLLEAAFLFGVYVFVASAAGAMFISQATTRSTLHLAGFKTALVCGFMGVLLALSWEGAMPNISIMDPRLAAQGFESWETALWCLFGGAVGGWMSAMVALTLTPLIESLLDYTTDLKLLELARMDHPLLRELVLKAPGTYHHSIIVGSLCEAAAEAVGANALMCRVAAYYHDIGKIGRAEYFVENQGPVNPHDKMKPHLSAKLIIAHVKEGKKIAKEYKLGEAITDFIMEHHGRSMVRYFYNRAQQEAAQPGSGQNPDSISEDDFRYPGPNPRSKETAIMALADSCEAATRSLVDPTPARIEAMVHKIINKSLNEGILDQAEITLREVRLAGKAFTRILMGLHHHRVEYPDQEEGLPERSAPQATMDLVQVIETAQKLNGELSLNLDEEDSGISDEGSAKVHSIKRKK